MGSVDVTPDEVTADEVTAELAVLLARFTALATAPDGVSDAARIDRIAVCADGLEWLSARQAAALARRFAYAADPAGYVNRGRTARGDRRVTLRPAPDR